MLVISDTSALSALAETAMLDFLLTIAGRITITESIRSECIDAGAPLALRQWISSPPNWLEVLPDPAVLLPETSVLDPGEASAISLAWQHRPDCRLIIDEKRGRAVAAALGLRHMGVLAIVIAAARRGELNFDTAIQRLQAVGFHMSLDLIKQARQAVQA